MSTRLGVPVLRDDILYSGDNGRQFCGKHAGVSARFSGRDISGQKVAVVTVRDVETARRQYGVEFACETCGFQPPLVVVAGAR